MTLQGKGKTDDASPISSHAEDTSANQNPSHEEISFHAYEICLQRGGMPGNELDDWLQAERELENAALQKAGEITISAKAQ